MWRGQAVVAAVALARGRAVAEWQHEVRKGRLEVRVLPLSGWKPGKHLASVKREAKLVAAHLGISVSKVSCS